MVELTERQWQVWEGVQARKTPQQIAQDMGGVTVSYVTQLRGELRDLGLIARRNDLPAHGRYEETYPWVVLTDQVTYKPALPPKARLRLAYPRDSARDLTVAPIRHVWWPDPDPRWSVQGMLMDRPDGKKPKEALSDHVVVVVTDLVGRTKPVSRSLVVPVRQPWYESQTSRWLELVVTDDEVRPMTLLIAAAIGVEPVFDLTTLKECAQ